MDCVAGYKAATVGEEKDESGEVGLSISWR